MLNNHTKMKITFKKHSLALWIQIITWFIDTQRVSDKRIYNYKGQLISFAN